jgi:hypothetical protein
MGIPLIGAVASIGSALIGAYTASKAAKAQADAARYAADLERKNFQDTQNLLTPSINAGNLARDYQLGALGLPGSVGYDEAMNAFRTSPGYEFQRNQGLNAVQTSAAAGGQLFSGKTLKSLTNYGQGLADQEFGNWYGRLGGLSGSGDAATGNLVNAGANTTNSLASLATSGGDARASSYAGMGDALGGGLNNLAYLSAYYGGPKRQQPFSGGSLY